MWGDKSRAKSEDEDAFKARPKTTTWRVRDVEDDGNTTITSTRGMDARDLDEARAELNGIVAAARDGGRSPVPFGNTRPPDDVAEAFDQLKTENAALRHELAQSLKAADILAAGGARGGILAQSLADGDAPNRALEVSQRSVEGALVQGAGPPMRRGLSLFDTVRRVQRGCAPVCAVSAERTMVPERGPRVSVWGAHEKAVASAIEDRISRTQSLDCVSRLRAAVSRVNERDGYTTAQRIYGAFRDAGFMTLTPGDVEDLCGGLSLDQRGRVDVGELLRLCVDVADECAESLLGAGDLVTRFGPRLGGPPEGWSGDRRDDRRDEKSDAEDGERRRRSRSRRRSSRSRRRSSRSRRRSSRSRSGSPRRSPRRSRRDKDRRSRSRSGSRDRKRSSRRGDDRKRSASRRGEDALYAKVRAKRDGSRAKRESSRRDRDKSPRSRRGDRDRDDSPRSRRTASSRVLAKRDRSVKGRDGYPVGKGRRDPRKRRDDDSDSHDDRSRQDRGKSRRRRDDDSTTIESRRDKSRRRPKDDDSADGKSRRDRRDGSRAKRRGDDDSVDEKSLRDRGKSRRHRKDDDSGDEKYRRRDGSRVKRRGDDDSADAKSRRDRDKSRRHRKDDDSVDEKSRRRDGSRAKRRGDDSVDARSRRRRDDAGDGDRRRPARDTNRRVTETIVDTVKRQSRDDGLRSPRDAFARSLRRLFEDMDVNKDGVLSKREIRAALLDLGKRDKENAFLKPKELRDLFGEMDLNGDGKVSYDELVDFLVDHVAGATLKQGTATRATNELGVAKALRRHFADVDKDGSGDLSKREVRDALVAFARKDRSGNFPTKEALRALFEELDLNGDGYVSYDELCESIEARVAGPRSPARRAAPRRHQDGSGDERADPRATFAQALKKHFADLDKSGDGDLSKKEVKRALTAFAKKDRKGAFPKLKELAALFASLDLDGDGYVSYDEICEYIDGAESEDPRRAFARALKAHFEKLDKSGDDDLSKKEVKAALIAFTKKDKTGKFPKLKELADIFRDLDLNGDGHVSYDELSEFIADVGAGRDTRRADAGADGKQARRASPRRADARATFAKALKKHFDDLDKSGDGDLSKREVKAALASFAKKDKKGTYLKLKELASIFEDMDLDGDGHVSYEEICDYIDERLDTDRSPKKASRRREDDSGDEKADPRATFAQALKKHFDDLDKSGDGDLSKREVKEALRSFAKKDKSGTYPKLKELNALFDAMDLDGDGHVSYDEVCEYIDERLAGDGEPRRSPPKDAKTTFAKALKKHFDDLDKSGDGDLSKREVKAALASFAKKDKKGTYLKLKELASIFEDMDLDGDGHVSYEEICDYIDDRAGGSDEDADDDGSADDDASRGSRDSCLTAGEAQALLKTLKRSASDGRVPMGALLKAAPRRCEKKLRHLAQAAQPGSASQRKRLGRTACRLRRALTHRAKPSSGGGKVDLRELEDAEPELFEEGTLACFRDCCARLAGCSEKDADALFRLIDDDRDGVLGRREIIEFVRDSGESWSRRAGLDAAALDISPRSDGDVSAQYSDDDDDDRSVAFEPLVKKLLGTTSTKKKSAPHLRAVASRIAGALVEDRDGDYDEGHAGKARQGFLTRHLYDALEKEERRKGQGVAWDVLKKELERRGVIRALSSRDLELLRDEFSEDGHLVRDWRNLLKIVDEAAGEAPDASPRSQGATVARSAAQQLLDAAARGEQKGSDSDSEEGGRDNFIQSLKDLFADMDADGDGVLTKREVRDKLGDLGERSNTPGLRPHQVQKLFDAIDGDGDGEVTYEELVDFLVEQTEAM